MVEVRDTVGMIITDPSQAKGPITGTERSALLALDPAQFEKVRECLNILHISQNFGYILARVWVPFTGCK